MRRARAIPLLAALTLASVAPADAGHRTAKPYIVAVTGTKARGFEVRYSNSASKRYPPYKRAKAACWNRFPISVCLGRVAERYHWLPLIERSLRR